MTEPVLMIDYDKCNGCRSCEIACSLASSGEANPQKSRVRIIKVQEVANMIPFPVVCMHCENPPCQAVCPMNAISTDPHTKARRIDTDKCIGCSACVYTCPFGAIALDRSMGNVFTCNLCDGDPTCAKFCPTEALQYVDGDEVNVRRARSRLDKYLDFVQAKSE